LAMTRASISFFISSSCNSLKLPDALRNYNSLI
jgi:hypothetical protein